MNGKVLDTIGEKTALICTTKARHRK